MRTNTLEIQSMRKEIDAFFKSKLLYNKLFMNPGIYWLPCPYSLLEFLVLFFLVIIQDYYMSYTSNTGIVSIILISATRLELTMVFQYTKV